VTEGLKEFTLLDVTHIVDGDTFDALVQDDDVGEIDGWKLSGQKVIRIRLIHLDTPEKGKPGYEQAGSELREWLETELGYWGTLTVLAQVKKDSFGRYISDVFPSYDRARTASEHMLTEANNGQGWDVWLG
jgi:endonuclease YncB( thermonuclease family)